MKLLKKYTLYFIIGLSLAFTSVLGYATVEYINELIDNRNVTVGDTVLYTDGIVVSLVSYDNNTLTYFELSETDTQKHYLIYEYEYTILSGYNELIISSIGDDIVINDILLTDTTATITFSLNQEKTFNSGDVLNVQFLFEAVEENLGGFTATDPININTASETDLAAIGLSAIEIERTITQRTLQPFSNMNEWAIRIEVSGFYERYSEYAVAGIIIFE